MVQSVAMQSIAFIDGVGRQSGPSTLRTTEVRPRRVSSSLIGTLVG